MDEKLREILENLYSKGAVWSINYNHAERTEDIKNALSQISALYINREELVGKVEGLVDKINGWHCDNQNCGRGAICNFCALRIEVLALLKGETK